MKAKKLSQINSFDGLPKESDYKLVEEELPPIKDGEFLVQAEYFSVDPYLRAETKDSTSRGGQVSKIIESKSENFPVGGYVVGHLGWRSHTIISNPKDQQVVLWPSVLDAFPKSYALGVLGMPGMTAYFGFFECYEPKSGETVVVSTAAGAVGCLVGQIAKIKGCKVIGYTGTDDKVKWLEELGFDHVFNYKKVDLAESLKSSAPDGVDWYFDNVGGEFATTVMRHMRMHGRVIVCGAISTYNDAKGNPTKASCIQLPVISKRLTIRGIYVYDWLSKFPDGIKQMVQWISEGKIKYKETITEGIENTPKAFIAMLKGENIGKAIVKI